MRRYREHRRLASLNLLVEIAICSQYHPVPCAEVRHAVVTALHADLLPRRLPIAEDGLPDACAAGREAAGVQRRPTELGHRGVPVHEVHEPPGVHLPEHARCLQVRMLAPDHGAGVDAALPVCELCAPEGSVVAPTLDTLASPYHPAVVAGKDHDVIVIRVVRLKKLGEVEEGGIGCILHAAEVPSPLADDLAAALLPNSVRLVGVVVRVHGVVQEEGLLWELVLVLQEEGARNLVVHLRVVLPDGAFRRLPVRLARAGALARKGV
mmetsp:Transcript_114883/g.336057  ORF Transcript_114883/g.336057 Transcript_114883/m.336057 type:complete len:266 (-) Transcript_114883:842-1639(-)